MVLGLSAFRIIVSVFGESINKKSVRLTISALKIKIIFEHVEFHGVPDVVIENIGTRKNYVARMKMSLLT